MGHHQLSIDSNYILILFIWDAGMQDRTPQAVAGHVALSGDD